MAEETIGLKAAEAISVVTETAGASILSVTEAAVTANWIGRT